MERDLPMRNRNEMAFEIRRLGTDDVQDLQNLMEDVISRLPDQDLFAMDEEGYLLEILQEKGEVYGAYFDGNLLAYTILAYPGMTEQNLGREFGVPEHELPLVGVLDSTIVHESARGLGLQRQFHELREQRAREKGCLYLYSTVHPENHASLKNLQAAGFTLQFTRPMYGGKERHCLTKRLE